MKTSNARNIRQEFFRYSPYVLLLTLLLSACQSSDDEPSPKTSSCKVLSQSTSGTGVESPTITYTFNYTFTYTYDEKGNQISSSATYNYNYSDGKTARSSSSTSNQFDDKGFIVRRSNQYSSTDKDGKTSSQSYNSEYSYQDERLAKESIASMNNGVAKTYSYSYEYDTKGNVAKFSNTYDNSYAKFEYSNKRIVKMTMVDYAGNVKMPFVEYNDKGLLIKSIETRGSQTDENRYEYDAEGQVIRRERYINSKPSSASSSDYDTKENPNNLLYAPFKGHPEVPGLQPYYAPKHNIIKETYYSGNIVTNVWDMAGTSNYVYDYNGKNFPVDLNYRNLDKDGKEQYTQKTTFQYQDCQ